jgi:hypothetical protein
LLKDNRQQSSQPALESQKSQSKNQNHQDQFAIPPCFSPSSICYFLSNTAAQAESRSSELPAGVSAKSWRSQEFGEKVTDK